MRGTVLSIGLILATLGLACEEPPPMPVPTTEPATQPDRPTTQQLIDGPWKRTPIGYVPVSLELPEGWEVKTFGDASQFVFLEGPAPRDDVKIQLAQRPTVTAERLQFIQEGAVVEKAENPHIRLDEFRKLGNVTVRERQVAGTPTSVPSMNDNGLPVTDTSPAFRWTITLFIPRDETDFRSFELNFIGLTVNQFQADESFLRRMIDSMKYDETVPVSTPTPAPSNP